MMKKGFVIALALAQLLTLGLPAKASADPQEKLEVGMVRGNDIPAIIQLLTRGDIIEVTEEVDDTFSSVTTGERTGIMETQLLRFADEEPYEPWTGYAMHNTGIYATYELAGKPIKTLSANTKLEILDELDDCYIIPFEQKTKDENGDEIVLWETAFVPKTQVSKHPVQSDSGSSSGGGFVGGEDGGDIAMAAAGFFHRLSQVSLVRDGMVRADGAKVILRFYQAGDLVQIVPEEKAELEGFVKILAEGEYAFLPEEWVQREGDPEFTQWDGYAGADCRIFENYLLRGKPVKQLSVNTKLTVLWETEDVFLVQVGDLVGYVSAKAVRTTPVPPSSGSDTSESGIWTPPVL